jgi:hypothetical protein
MNVEIKTKRLFTCPNGCAHEFVVEHILREENREPRTAGPWYCDDCGQGWRITYSRDGIDVTAAQPDGKKHPQWVILELPPQSEPVRFKVRGQRFSSTIDEDRVRYFYEEHTCPTNWLRDVDEVSIGGSDDPHGLWRLVSVYDAEAVPSPSEEP